MEADSALTTDGSPPPIEEADLWGLDSFPASDPPQNW